MRASRASAKGLQLGGFCPYIYRSDSVAEISPDLPMRLLDVTLVDTRNQNVV